MIHYFLLIISILLSWQNGCQSACITETTTESPPFEHTEECKLLNARTCTNTSCTRGEFCEMDVEILCKKEPCCPFPQCYDICSRVVCPCDFCANNPKTICALRQTKNCIIAPCCPNAVCEDPKPCNSTQCEERCRGNIKLVRPFVLCNSGCICDRPTPIKSFH